EAPFGFEPLRRAVTPDDHVTVVLDDTLPHAAELLAGVLDHLRTAGIEPAAVIVVTPPGSAQTWIDELPDEFADVTAETHDPADHKKLAYLASTKAGRRLYLNRTLVEADFVILLTGRDSDPLTGYAGAEAAIFPALADEEVRTSFAGQFSKDAPAAEPGPVRTEAAEAAWLLGTPFLVQVIPGAGDSVQAVVAGLLESGAEGIRQQDARWRSSVAGRPDTVIAAVSGAPGRATFLDFAKAAACAARVVAPGGRIAVLSEAAPPLGEGAETLRRSDDPKMAAKALTREKPDDWAACFLWGFAAKTASSLFLASGYPDEVTEDLFATPLRGASEVQRLIDAGERVLVIPDAHRSMVTVG
ncbi:MAG TPA: lactate racemase domain-containing protein, partial [Gemmataceae bacterium]|nr:lactate racemase domain-containing protein [Gemmataceae bacterium]